MSRFRLGIILIIIGVLLVCLFMVRSYYSFYWLHPAILISITVIGGVSGILGGFFTSFYLRQKALKSVLWSKIMIGVGSIITILALIVWFISIYMAISISIDPSFRWGDNHSGMQIHILGDKPYLGEIAILLLQIGSFVFSIVAGIIGSFLLGFGIKNRNQIKIN
jgi:hypothetical protein